MCIRDRGIPYKGQMLNQIAAKFLDATTDICPNGKMATPDPMVTVGVLCEGFPVEMIAVSYTHLDVYKRQSERHALPHPSGLLLLLQFRDAETVSYTHLTMYLLTERQ